LILLISPEPWLGHTVSKHHYAIELAKRGHEVFFYGPPQEGPMRLLRVASPNGTVTLLCAPRVAPGLRYLPSKIRRVLEARWLRHLEAFVEKKFDLIWLFENSRFFNMRFAGDRVKIYHQVDLNQNFQPEIAAKTADHVFCTSKPIRDRLSTVRSDAIIVHHGVQTDPFDPSTEASLFSREQINCVYVGNLSMDYLDRELMLRCLERYPDVLFHFFGGFKTGDPFQSKLAEYENVRLHGKVEASRILPILANADILMVAYQKAHFQDQSNPHKMMEYMMSGKVTVATYTSEYECVSHLLAMCSQEGDYVELLGKVIDDLEAWNSPERIKERQTFAANNTYSRQLDRIAEALGSKGYLIS
jgi:hypothetical protein